MHLSSLRFLSLLAFATTISALPAAEYKLADSPGQHLDVLKDGKPVARYMNGYDKSTPARLNETYKPYLHVFDPTGETILTKGVGGDFPHHRGIFLGWNKIGIEGKSYDRWHMKGGEQVHEKFLEQKADASGATFTSLVKWKGAGEDVILEEERTIQVLPASAPFYAVVDVTSKVKAVAGDTALSGDPEHAGLQFRPAQEVDRSKTAFLFPKENADPKNDRDYPWFAENFTLKGNAYSVVYLNHPSNPKEARTSAYRDYGRFGTFFDTSVKKDETLTVKVRFLLSAGELPSAEVIQKEWNSYSGKSEPTPTTTLKHTSTKGTPQPKKNPSKPKEPAKS